MGTLIPFPGADNPFTARLEKAGEHVRETQEAYQLALESRNTIVHDAVDNGYPQAAAARALKVSRPSITRILGVPPKQGAAREASAA